MSDAFAKTLEILGCDQSEALGQVEHVAEVRGPNGGDLNNPKQFPARRQSPLNAELDAAGMPKLHRFEKPDVAMPGLKNEQAWHRMAAYMLLAGRNNSEIAMSAGVEVQTISVLRSQRWFQELLATLANNEGEELLGLITSEAQNSINEIVRIRDSSESDRVRLAAATTLLEHAHGKPVQKILSAVSHSVHSTPEIEMENIKQELEILRSRQ